MALLTVCYLQCVKDEWKVRTGVRWEGFLSSSLALTEGKRVAAGVGQGPGQALLSPSKCLLM